MKLTKVILFLFICLFVSTGALSAQDAKSDSTKTEPDSTLSDYQKLFKAKKVKTSNGLITLHKINEKVYFEFPKHLLGQKMLLGSVVIATSSSSDAATGEQGNRPLPIFFTRHDSVVYIRKAIFSMIANEDDAGLHQALAINSVGPVIASFDIKAESPDSAAIVFEPTGFFVDGNKKIDPFGPYSGYSSKISQIFGSKSYSFDSGNSMLVDVKAFKQNITITSILSFNKTSSFLGMKSSGSRPLTFKVRRSLLLLPEETMAPRIRDPRIGVNYSQYTNVTENGMKPVYYAHRWQLIPADKEAYIQGDLVSPRKPIVIYVDDKFPEQWMPYIIKGIKDWNKAFREIGLKNAIEIQTFDEANPSFDPFNISYNTINYVTGPATGARGMAWVDPRSGEILSASAYIYKGLIKKLSNELFLAMSPSVKRARTLNMPVDLMGKAIRDVVAHQVGHMLGLADNLGASFSIPTESLRSPSFTQKYGITPSIMDNVYFNFVAQPGDVEKGVKWTRPNLGVYDYYAIAWLYSPLYYADSRQEKQDILRKLVSEKVKNPMYRIHKSQINGITDPAVPPVRRYDLGNNKRKATAYALKNLQFILENIDEWLKDEDESYNFRTSIGPNIINIKFFWYLWHVGQNIGGVYQYANLATDGFPAYQIVPERIQQKSVLFLLNTLKNLRWLNTPVKANSISGDPAGFMRNALIPYIMNVGMAKLAFTQAKSANNYTQTEFLNDIFDYVWASVIEERTSTETELQMQEKVLAWLIQNQPVKADEEKDGSRAGTALKSGTVRAGMRHTLYPFFHGYNLNAAVIRHALLNNNRTAADENLPLDSRYTIFNLLLRSEDLLKKAIALNGGKAEIKYQYMLLKVQRALDIEG